MTQRNSRHGSIAYTIYFVFAYTLTGSCLRIDFSFTHRINDIRYIFRMLMSSAHIFVQRIIFSGIDNQYQFDISRQSVRIVGPMNSIRTSSNLQENFTVSSDILKQITLFKTYKSWTKCLSLFFSFPLKEQVVPLFSRFRKFSKKTRCRNRDYYYVTHGTFHPFWMSLLPSCHPDLRVT